MTSHRVRIGNAHGFWGDRLEAAAELLESDPQLDFLTLDFLAEVSMSILAAQRRRDEQLGYAADFVHVVRSLAPYWQAGGKCRVVANAGGLNPRACAEACRAALAETGCQHVQVASVSGDDVLSQLRRGDSPLFRNLDTGEPIERVAERLITANAYLGARPIADALARGAQLVVTGRVADPSLVVGPCVHHFGWRWDDWNRLAGATVAGHLIECGTQVTGGIATDWLELAGDELPAFPIVEVSEDGGCVVTKPATGGGRVTEATVREQLVYEIGDPDRYLSPDVEVSFLGLQVHADGDDRVRVSGARGRPAPETLKVSATWQRGFRAAGQLAIFGIDAVEKARRAAAALLARLETSDGAFEEAIVEVIGAGACDPRRRAACSGEEPDALRGTDEVVLRIAVADTSRERVERFSRALMSLITAGPPGVTGYADGRPRVHPGIAYWPCLVEASKVEAKVELVGGDAARRPDRHGEDASEGESLKAAVSRVAVHGERLGVEDGGRVGRAASPSCGLASIAAARSGDKGRHANIGVLARREEDYPRLKQGLTPAVVARWLGIDDVARVERFELPNLWGLNFVVRNVLDSSLRTDAQGKALGQVLLSMPLSELAESQGGEVGGSDGPREEEAR